MSVYHDKVFELARWWPSPSDERIPLVRELESNIQRSLPAAVRELLASDAWPHFLAIRLGPDDDPEVLVEVDSWDPPEWQTCGVCFSTWLYCQVFDWKWFDATMFAAQAEPLSAPVFSTLRAMMTELPRTLAWPRRETIRLRGDLGDLILHSDDGECDWSLRPRARTVAREFLDWLPLPPELDDRLYAFGADAEEALSRWRSERSR